MAVTVTGPFSLERVVRAVEKVRLRLLKAAAALREAAVPYAVAGGNAVALWVSRVDEAAVRNTRDVDILIRREDFPAVTSALESVGFVHRRVAGIEVFLDDAWSSPTRRSDPTSRWPTPTSPSRKTPVFSALFLSQPWCRSNSPPFATRTAPTCAT